MLNGRSLVRFQPGPFPLISVTRKELIVSINLHYEAVLADLEQMKTDAEDGIRAINRLLSRTSPGASNATRPVPGVRPSDSSLRSPNNDEPSIPTRIVEFMFAHRGSVNAEEIAQALGNVNLKTVRGALARLYKYKKIMRVGRGKYRTASRGTGADPSAIVAESD